MDIIFIEESQEVRNMCSLVLRKNGHSVVFCEHGLEALSVIEKEPCHVLMLNVRSYLMSAVEVIYTFRGEYSRDELPIIVLGKSSQKAAVMECLEAGADDSLELPIKVNEMLAKLSFVEDQIKEAAKKKRMLAKAIIKKNDQKKADAALKLKEMEEKIKKDG